MDEYRRVIGAVVAVVWFNGAPTQMENTLLDLIYHYTIVQKNTEHDFILLFIFGKVW